jgi:hypothetical protein
MTLNPRLIQATLHLADEDEGPIIPASLKRLESCIQDRIEVVASPFESPGFE